MAMKVLLLAPVDVPGGIATWARIFRSETGLDVSCLDTARRYMVLGARQPFRRSVLGAATAVKRVMQCVATVRRERPDVVYVTCAPSLGLWLRDFPLLFILARLGVPTVVHLHGGSVAGFFGGSRPLRWLSVRAFGRAAAILVITRPVEALARELFGSEKVRYLPNMLPADYATSTSPRTSESLPFQVLHVGWQSREKGTLDVLETAARLPELSFVFVGPIPTDFQPVLDERISSLGLGDRVRFMGSLRGDDLDLAYANAGLLLFPTRFRGEGFPMVVLEAMAHGLPVVATDVGAIAEMLGVNTDEPAGYVVPGDLTDLEELVDHVSRLAVSAELRETLGSNGRRRVEHEYAAATIVTHLDGLIRCVGDGGALPE